MNTLKQKEIDKGIYIINRPNESFNAEKYADYFESLKQKGKISGDFYKGNWVFTSVIDEPPMRFEFDELAYRRHLGKHIAISSGEIKLKLRCFVMDIYDEFVDISLIRFMRSILRVIEDFGDKKVPIDIDCRVVIRKFFGFVGCDKGEIRALLRGIEFYTTGQDNPRELKPIINYLVTINEVNDLYDGGLGEEEFIRWFPIYFWANVTFSLPLRVTETMLTPFHCISKDKEGVKLTVRRTMMKKKHQVVAHHYKKDYKLFTYIVPYKPWVDNTLRYLELTKDHKRDFLFDYDPNNRIKAMTAKKFNYLLEDFINIFVIGNSKYDFSRFASGISEFEKISAGDSRPIAMATMRYQGISSDIIRQLADHENIVTSEGYYSNVSNTVLASSIVKLQREIVNNRKSIDALGISSEKCLNGSECGCFHRSQPLITGDIHECEKQGHVDECFGCKFYSPSKQQIDNEMGKRKEVLDKKIREIRKALFGKNKEAADQYILDVQTSIRRYGNACDLYVREKEKEWEKEEHTMTNYC